VASFIKPGIYDALVILGPDHTTKRTPDSMPIPFFFFPESFSGAKITTTDGVSDRKENKKNEMKYVL
jgi:hypothetical protein